MPCGSHLRAAARTYAAVAFREPIDTRCHPRHRHFISRQALFFYPYRDHRRHHRRHHHRSTAPIFTLQTKSNDPFDFPFSPPPYFTFHLRVRALYFRFARKSREGEKWKRRRGKRTKRGRQRNLNERSASDRDLIIELLAPVAADIINVG